MIKYIDMGLDDVLVMVSADVYWPVFVKEVSGYNLKGVEGLTGFQGSVGAAITKNFSAEGQSVGAVVSGVVCVDGNDGGRCRFTAAECAFSPGDSIFLHDGGRYRIVSVLMRLSRASV
ncbi:MAG: hypothetical protein LIQ26_04200 [Bacteroidota bacterium]|nr:hypothetical protein [Bacteroidota bacterium]